MPPTQPGFYCYTAPNGSDKVALDLQGPFPSRHAVLDWLAAHHVEYRQNAEAYDRAVLYFGEMTDQESERPWATAIHYRA